MKRFFPHAEAIERGRKGQRVYPINGKGAAMDGIVPLLHASGSAVVIEGWSAMWPGVLFREFSDEEDSNDAATQLRELIGRLGYAQRRVIFRVLARAIVEGQIPRNAPGNDPKRAPDVLRADLVALLIADLQSLYRPLDMGAGSTASQTANSGGDR